jgi:hypothetical protein
MAYLGDFQPGCRFRYQGRTLIVRAATASMVVAVPAHIRGEPDNSEDCTCIARTELQQSEVLDEECAQS